MKTERRSILKNITLSILGIAGLRYMANAELGSDDKKKMVSGVVTDQEVPLFSSSTKFGNLHLLVTTRCSLLALTVLSPPYRSRT